MPANPTVTSATSSGISITPGAATQLFITGQPPSTVASGSGFGFTVTAKDAEGNVATGFSGSETVALAGNPGSDTLAGHAHHHCRERPGVFQPCRSTRGKRLYARRS